MGRATAGARAVKSVDHGYGYGFMAGGALLVMAGRGNGRVGTLLARTWFRIGRTAVGIVPYRFALPCWSCLVGLALLALPCWP